MKYTVLKKLRLKFNEDNVGQFKEKNTIKVRDKRTRLNKEGLYEVYPLAIDDKHVYVVCPYCCDIHIHGRFEDSDGTYGSRSPHCRSKNSNNYYINK